MLGPNRADVRSPEEAAQKLEAVLLRQLLAASGVFKGGELAGGQIRADMFVEVLSDAVAKGGGLGIARMMERALGGQGAEGGPSAVPWTPRPLHRPGDLAPLGSTGLISSPFGQRRDPIEGDTRTHTGVDLAVPEGTPVRAVLDGVVKTVSRQGGYGESVQVDHGGGLTTLYAHNSRLLVSEGEKVQAGQTVALSGQTGRATGPHLHLEVRQNSRPIDPKKALNAYGVRVEQTVADGTHPKQEGGVP